MHRLPKRDAKEPSEPNESEGTEGEDTEGQSGSFREQRAKPDWCVAYQPELTVTCSHTTAYMYINVSSLQVSA